MAKTGELDEHEAMMFLEHRQQTKTAMELRALLVDIDKDGNHKLNFLEWCCFYFNKSYDDLNDFVDEEARARALAEAAEAAIKIQEAQKAIEEAKRKEEEDAAKEAAEIEEESKLTGVKGAAAFFKRQAAGAAQMSNKEKIQAEAARKRELRAAKEAEEKAKTQVNKQKTAEEIQEELRINAEKAAAEKKAQEEAAKKKEIDERKARIAARNAAFANGSHFKKGDDDA